MSTRVSTGRVARILAGILIAGASIAVHAQPGAVADYRFNGSLGDSLGNAPALTQLVPGDGTFIPVSFDGAAGSALAFSAGAGLSLALDGLIDGQDYSFAVLARFAAVGGWNKFIDTTALARDEGLYVHAGFVELYPSALSGAEPVEADQWYQFVMTRDLSGLVTVYLDGVEQFSLDDDVAGYAMISAERLLTFFRDDESTGNFETSPGAVKRIRLFNRALTAAEVARLENDRGGEVIFRNGFDPAPVMRER